MTVFKIQKMILVGLLFALPGFVKAATVDAKHQRAQVESTNHLEFHQILYNALATAQRSKKGFPAVWAAYVPFVGTDYERSAQDTIKSYFSHLALKEICAQYEKRASDSAATPYVTAAEEERLRGDQRVLETEINSLTNLVNMRQPVEIARPADDVRPFVVRSPWYKRPMTLLNLAACAASLWLAWRQWGPSLLRHPVAIIKR